jgi:DNA polymerase V
MGFPSPATDYIERRISITSLCSLGANTRVVETSDGYAVVDVPAAAAGRYGTGSI